MPVQSTGFLMLALVLATSVATLRSAVCSPASVRCDDSLAVSAIVASVRSAVTAASSSDVSALIAMNRPDQLRSHLGRARANGVTKEEMAALITHLAFYAGWPSAVTAVSVANEVYQSR